MGDARFRALKREPLLEEKLPTANPSVRLIKGARIKFAPGQPTGLHRHPVSTVGVATAGSPLAGYREGRANSLVPTSLKRNHGGTGYAGGALDEPPRP